MIRNWERIFIGSMVLAVLLSIAFVAYRVKDDPKSTEDLGRFYAKLKLGQSRNEVLAGYHDFSTSALQLNTGNDAWWLVRTPLTFSATNWTLFLEFDSDMLVGAYIRIHDTSHSRPVNAPADLMSPEKTVPEKVVIRYPAAT